MSGPKVVRVVTREELLARSMVLASQLDQALERWSKAAQKAGELNADDLAQAKARHARIRAELDAGRFAKHDREAGREIEFLASDLERRRELEAARLASRRTARIRVTGNAQALLKMLKNKGTDCDARLTQELETAARGDGDITAAEAALAAGFRLLAPSEVPASITDEQRGLAVRLADSGADDAQARWQAALSRARVAPLEPRIESIGRQLEMLRLLGHDASVLDEYGRRLDQSARQAEGLHSVKLDSLQLELTTAIRQARSLEALAGEAAVVLRGLVELDGEPAAKVRAWVQSGLAARDEVMLRKAIQAGRDTVASEVKAASARVRRAAVLQSLAKLGYAVHEGMETAWAESGRIVIRKPSQDGYGVELAGSADAERLQLRTVAFNQDRDLTRDTDAEQLWCGDFSRLQTDLALAGGAMVIEKAVGVGAVPLKVVNLAAAPSKNRSASSRTRGAS